MKRRIVVEYGEVANIAKLMGCTYEMVSHSLAFRKDTDLARRIRKMALARGGVEIGGDKPINNRDYEKDAVSAV